MINKLSIKGFKSIRQLDLDCRRVNVFIGEPSTGKTNILEALGLWCFTAYQELGEILRAESAAELFWDQDIANEILVCLDHPKRVSLKPEGDRLAVEFTRENGSALKFHLFTNLKNGPAWGLEPERTAYYLFKPEPNISSNILTELAAPFGQNLGALLYSSKQARNIASEFFKTTGLRLTVEHGTFRVTLTKDLDNIFIPFSYVTSSETIRRMVFYQLALDTNKDTPLVFDEPEAHAFPPYTKRLAERIASDDRGNQFFLTTHSPYLLDSLLSKTPASELNVVLCRMENFETKAYSLNETQIGKLMEWSMDAFFNFDRLLDEKE